MSITQLLTSQLKRYPTDLLQRIGFYEVIVCDALRVDGEPRVLTVSYDSGTLYLDCKLLESPRSLAMRLLHHEVFHLIDYRDDGEVYTDAQWLKLNPVDFAYLKDNALATATYGSLTEVLTGSLGLLTGYSSVAIEEDKAEVFSFMVVDPGLVRRRVEGDEFLRRKVAAIRGIIDTCAPGAALHLFGAD